MAGLEWPHREARDIAVRDFSVTYLWPLRLTPDGKLKKLRESAGNSENDWLHAYRQWIVTKDHRWHEIDDFYLDADRNLTQAARYSEFVYFHPYIHDILYKQGSKNGCRILGRRDIASARVQLRNDWGNPDRPAWILDVEEVKLFLFPTGVAILAVRVANPRAALEQEDQSQPEAEPPVFQLADALDFLDYARRVYHPFCFGSDPKAPGLVPVAFEWRGADGASIGGAANFGDARKFLDHCAEHRTMPVAEHWASILKPMALDDGRERSDKNPDGLFYGQVEDDRLPQLAYVSVDDPLQITEGDWHRLAFCDSSGNSSAFPYALPFLRKATRNAAYERFWDPPAYASRYFCVGYAFTLVTRQPPSLPLREHMAQHYFVLALLAHMQKASLLAFWQRLSQMVGKFALEPEGPDSRRRLYEAQQWLLQDLTAFVSRFYFIEVSNQLQALELFKLWRDQLGIERLYREVLEQSRFLAEVLETRSQAEFTEAQVTMAREQTRMSKEQTNLTRIANWLLPPALAAGLIQGLDSDGTDKILCWARDCHWSWPGTALAAKIALLFGLWLGIWTLWYLLPSLWRWAGRRWRGGRGQV